MIVVEWERVYARAMSKVGKPKRGGTTANNARHAPLAAFLSRFMPRIDQPTEQQEAENRLRRQERMLQQYLDLLQTVTSGQVGSITFVPGALGQTLLSDGWHDPEPQGVWSAAERAGVWLPETIIAQWGFSMHVECARYMPQGLAGDQVRTVAVSTGPTLLATWQFSPDQPRGPERKVIEIPPSLRPRGGQSMLLSFQVDRPIAPVEVGESEDRRTLGLQLTAFQAGSLHA